MSRTAPVLHFCPEQRFSCRRCGFCCANFEVTATAEEIRHIAKLSIPELPTPIESCFSPLKGNLSTIVKDPSKRCRFMDGDGLCLIHRHGGAEAKPLACRLYPFNIHVWTDGHISADLRFICPAVGDPDGQRTGDQAGHIREIAALMGKTEKPADTCYSESNPAGLAQVRCVHEGIKAIIYNDALPFALRLYAAVKILDFHASPEMRTAISAANGDFKTDAADFAIKAAPLLARELEGVAPLPLRERIDFRSLIGGYLRDDSSSSAGSRFSRMWHFVAFGLGKGSLQQINASCPDTRGIDCLECSRLAAMSPEAAEQYRNFFHGKLESMHFCSRYAHHYTYELGLRHLLLTAPVAFSLAAAFAAAERSPSVDASHMRRVLTYIDTTFSLSPYFRRTATRRLLGRLTVPATFAALLKGRLT